MSITSGQFFTYILLGITPTALGRAVDHDPADAAAWSTALTQDILNGVSVEGSAIVTEYQNLLSTYPQIYTALLMTIYVPDGSGGYAPVPLAKIVKDQINSLGLTPNFLDVPWSNPPHPSGQDVTNLINLLTPYDET